jgi:hypothetical protein
LELSRTERIETVKAFNARYGKMEQELWRLSKECRGPLLDGDSSNIVEEFVWAVKCRWRVLGIRWEERVPFAHALASLDWSANLFDEPLRVADDAEEYAFGRVTMLVDRSRDLGLRRREFSLASKVLHWLLPWRIPAYDAKIKKLLGVHGEPPNAYRLVTQQLFAYVRELPAEDREWLGPIEPRTPLRGFDKCLWWFGGGRTSSVLW